MRLIVALIAVLCLSLAAVAGGLAPFGRLALSLGVPGLAAELFTDPYWQGVARFRQGDFAGAAQAFDAAGPDALYDLGNAEVQQENYAAALEAYDLAQMREVDPEAQANFDLVRAFYGGTPIEAGSVFSFGDRDGDVGEAPIARGKARGAGQGDEATNSGSALDMVELQGGEQTRVRRVFDDSYIVASPRWLATLEDVPGAFLAARILTEYKSRKEDGTGQVPEDTEW